MPRGRTYPRYNDPIIGRCYYCGQPVRRLSAARVEDPAISVWDAVKGRHVPIRRTCHSNRSGMFCEDILRERFTVGKRS